MNKIILFILIVFLVCLPYGAKAAVTVSSLPYSNTFSSADDITNLDRNSSYTAADNVRYNASGWNGGCAEIIPPYANEGCTDAWSYTCAQESVGLGVLNLDTHPTVVHVRFLLKIGSTYESTAQNAVDYGYQNKFLVGALGTDSNNHRPMILLDYICNGGDCASLGVDYFKIRSCNDNDICTSDPTPLWRTDNYHDEWVCVEAMWDIPNQLTRIYVWTQDEVFNGQQGNDASFHPTITDNYISNISIIGGFFNGNHTQDANNHIYIDELVISDSYIGPPAGFVGATSSSTTGCTISGASMQ